jgi:hypothetical protein
MAVLKNLYFLLKKMPAANSTYPRGGVSCSKDSFGANQTLVFFSPQSLASDSAAMVIESHKSNW